MRGAVESWLKDWRLVDSGPAHYRLLFRDRRVLYCEDLKSGVTSAFVEGALDSDRAFLGSVGPIVTDNPPTGIRIHLPRGRLEELLRWCTARDPALWPIAGNLRGQPDESESD